MKLRGLWFALPIAVLALANLITQQYYVDRSRSVNAGPFAELPFVSNRHALSTLKAHRGHWSDTVFSTSFNRRSAHLQEYYVNPSRIEFLSIDSYDTIGETIRYCGVAPCRFTAPLALFRATDERIGERAAFFKEHAFTFLADDARAPVRFLYDERALDKNSASGSQVIESPYESVLNRWSSRSLSEPNLYDITTVTSSPNYLVFVPTAVGTAVLAGTSGRVSMFPVERDPFFQGDSFSAVGRYLVFRVLSPSERPRLEISVSTTARGQGNPLPQAAVVGRERIALPLVGRGSARVFSDVIAPQAAGGIQLLGLDLGTSAAPLREPYRSPLMNLYGRNVKLEGRKITAFARDISLVDDRQYRAIEAPRSVRQFPRDLTDRNLEYSGMYEDGWTSEQSYFVLRSTKETTTLRVHGVVPLIDDPYFRTQVCMSLDRLKLDCRAVNVGEFDFSYPLGASSAGNHEVRLTFDRYQRLPGGDDRPIGMKLTFLGFES